MKVLKRICKLYRRPFIAALICNSIENRCYYLAFCQMLLALIWGLIVTSYKPDFQAAACVLSILTHMSFLWIPIGIYIFAKSFLEGLLFFEYRNRG